MFSVFYFAVSFLECTLQTDAKTVTFKILRLKCLEYVAKYWL